MKNTDDSYPSEMDGRYNMKYQDPDEYSKDDEEYRDLVSRVIRKDDKYPIIETIVFILLLLTLIPIGISIGLIAMLNNN